MLTTQQANHEYCTRPDDEKFKTIEDLYQNALDDARRCGAKTVKLGALEAINKGGNIALRSKDTGAVADLTHWSFSQFCREVKAPAGHYRDLNPNIATMALNDCLSRANRDLDKQLFFRKTDDGLTLRALTTPDYSRIHDAVVVRDLVNRLRDRNPQLTLPPVWEGGNGGAYRGDRDMFCILVDGGSIVNDPTIGFGGTNGKMFRGVIVRNSDVGAYQLEILTFLFRGICGNHNIWGVENATNNKRRHVGDVAGAFRTMGLRALEFFRQPASADEQRIKALGSIELGKDKPEVITAGRGLGLTEEQATGSFVMAEEYEPNPRSVWGFAQGITRFSQSAQYQDDRLALDLVAAKLMRRKVAA